MGGDETGAFRLYYNDHCIHDDRAEYLDDPQHQIDYLGMLHQALLDVAAWDFEKTNDFSKTLELALEEDGRVANVAATHVFDAPGTYFPVIKVKSNRHGDATDIFTQCKNLDRVRVIVK